MLNLNIPAHEHWDNHEERFIRRDEVTLPPLEHSLIAISKWEMKYRVPFMKSVESLHQSRHSDKFLYYINCMSTRGEIPEEVLKRLGSEELLTITKYIADPHSASIISGGRGGKKGGSKKPVTSERIYALMACYRIPHEYAKWHLNNLLAVIDICEELNEDPKKRRNRSDPSATAAYLEQNEKLRKAGKPL